MRGFTIIEILVVMAVLSLLATMALPLAETANKRAKERELRAALWEMRTAIDRYKQAYDDGHIASRPSASGYPRTLDELINPTQDIKNSKQMYFLRRIPRDPFVAPDFQGDSHGWGLRSYASSADKPRPGDDVYDVYSLSQFKAFDNTPYSNW